MVKFFALALTALQLNLRMARGSELDIEEEFAIAGIQLPPTNGLAGRRFQPSAELMNNTGPGIQEKLYEMNTLYTKYKTNRNAFTTQDHSNLSTEAAKDFNFDRFCFYGCYCLPDKSVHDDSPGLGKPVDVIDNSCKELKQCYQCAGKDTKEDTGEHCDQESSYSMQLINDANGQKDVLCTNEEGSCRWRICQCDRNFAHKLRDQFYKGYYNAQYRYNQATGDGFDRSTCQAIQVPGEKKQCCGSYTANLAYQQRQPISSNTHQCCADQRIKLCCENTSFWLDFWEKTIF
ncbi:Oidioi.mRNA.OKI2018_I69.PAR.g9282.t1.cds [Oikopleura dioica]|uniref:Oidioi.mRNA.OKI2018_I69.PAR.g9282.t1.cds n=1 Tax=Oikopleura dioica TaxID=34765 RepID=A0ABN7RQT3_OIKDI|nr:Oidioi.mRNA.OKI2018_I69.PAR.g9282.t1.cds [Oikopleura dioica]